MKVARKERVHDGIQSAGGMVTGKQERLYLSPAIKCAVARKGIKGTTATRANGQKSCLIPSKEAAVQSASALLWSAQTLST